METNIRTLSFDEFQLLCEWAVAENWNIGVGDPAIFHATDPVGFFGAFHEEQMIGAISAVAYDEHFGFIGFFVVKPEYRGHNVGVQLGQHAMAYLGDRVIGVDGVEGKIHNYEHCGFKLAHYNIRYEGIADDEESRNGVVEGSGVPFEHINRFDRQFFPAERKCFLSQWLNQSEGFSLADYDGKQVNGYGVIRKCRNGYKIGPLFANTPEVARRIFINLTAKLPFGETFYLDIPACNPDAQALVNEHGMRQVFKTARMYANGIPALPLQGIYGITSFELG